MRRRPGHQRGAPVHVVFAATALLAAAPHAAAAQTAPPAFGLANPAAQHCVTLGAHSVIRQGARGQYGICIFADGRVCEEWTLFREARCVLPGNEEEPSPREIRGPSRD
jgi:uncharacterized protein